MRRILACLILVVVAACLAPGQPPGQSKAGTGKATPPERFQVAKDFKVELLYTVPRDRQGSWVNLCVMPDGGLIASDQGGAGLFRITPPPVGGDPAGTKVEKLPVDISSAQGLLWAFDSLYVMVNGGSKGPRPNGLYRVRASKPGGALDSVEQLRTMQGAGEHGPHAIVLSPDGRSIFCVCGNDTRLTELSGSAVPKLWANDNLFPIVASFSGVVPPAGCIYKVDPDGKNWELWSAGYRNEYDAAFNRYGDLFTFDSDMEWDQNTPWYRPTRVIAATSGGDFGFRNGSFVFPPRFADSLPAVADVGPGSPTGVCFGYGAKFPAKYQEALYVCDWSFGRLFAVHTSPDGSSYKGQVEEIVTGAPLALTDVVVNPKDGALYFTVGGRNAQSALYRVTYAGQASTAPSQGAEPPLLNERRRMEAFHGKSDPAAVGAAWPYLGNADRFLRYAARVAVEHQPVKEWQDRALAETNPVAATQALLALARVAGKESTAALKEPFLAALDRVDWEKLTDPQRDDVLRVYTVLFSRLGPPDAEARDRFLKRFGPLFPTNSYELNADLCQLLVYLDAPGVAEKTLKLMAAAPSQEEQIGYAMSLGNLKQGWTPALNRTYFQWFQKSAAFRGGQRFQQYLNDIKQRAAATLTAKEREELGDLLAVTTAPAATAPTAPPRPVVKKWALDELASVAEKGLAKRDFDHGRQLFGEAKCFTCHRYDSEGGSLAPDLTVVSARLSVRDLLDKVINPNKSVSDQYAPTVFTLKDGRTVVGRVANLQGDGMSVQTDMLNPARLTRVNAGDIESTKLSNISPMPTGLLDTFNEDEVLDLMAYVLSRGDRKHEMFKK